MNESLKPCNGGPTLDADLTGGNRAHVVPICSERFEALGLDPDRFYLARTSPVAKTVTDVQQHLFVTIFRNGDLWQPQNINVGGNGIKPSDKVRFESSNVCPNEKVGPVCTDGCPRQSKSEV